jgi:uncharacterized Zn finger protein
MSRGEAPEAAIVRCPSCGEEQLHDVLQAAGAQGDATVRCRECGRVHRALLQAAKPVEVHVIVSHGGASTRIPVSLPGDEEIAAQDELIAGERQVQVRALDRHDGKRVRKALARDVATIWAVDWEEFTVKFSVNMGRKTISKKVQVSPQDAFSVGDELDLDRLRIAIHAIKTREGTLHRGTAEARDIVRIFARPLRLDHRERRARRAALGMPEPKQRIRERRKAGRLPPVPEPARAPAREAPRPRRAPRPRAPGPRRNRRRSEGNR